MTKCAGASKRDRSAVSASPGSNRGAACHTSRNSRSNNATLVIELRDTTTRASPSVSTGRVENSITLCTGPSQEMAMSGSNR
jgi:hypothetical protein